ncbi:MAG: RsmB/NOP family class I SAM-dependent RNA methyltransferase [Bacteroidia bacterium]|nr:RsmB/NOP family class I SAM-dependent RNA methyltransferase [Bacteroidia bacterium]MDW8014582.1 RsmB/NOP family class I SAM-dependent RNA methyltransferase [Bacteroidia bacterium]
MKLPPEFVERMQKRLGLEAEAFFEALEQPPSTSVRLHPQKGQGLFEEAQPVPWHPLGRVLRNRPSFETDPLWHAGAYYVQEAAGMSLRAFLPERRPLRIIDLSAAPGGKATLILGEIQNNGGLLIANDPHPSRRLALQENLERWGIPAYFITGRHPQYWARRYPEAFDVVVLDAPCSGEGLWRKEPRTILQWSPSLTRRMQRLQRNLLFAAKALVAPGGRLIYSTCTFAPEENEENLAYLFSGETTWRPVVWEAPPAVVCVSYRGQGIGYYFYPHRTLGEGFFISAWEKAGRPSYRIGRMKILPSPFPLPPEIQVFRGEKALYALTEAAFKLLPPRWEEERWTAFPLQEGSRPAHAAALLTGGNGLAFPHRALSQQEFIAYLRGESFEGKAPIEWVTAGGEGVGWLYKGKPSLPFTWQRFLGRHVS